MPVEAIDAGIGADLAHQAAQQAGLVDFVLEFGHLAGRRRIPFLFQLSGNLLLAGQQIRRQVLGFAVVVATAMHEADAARFHHAEEELLFLIRIGLPDQQTKQRPDKAPLQLP